MDDYVWPAAWAAATTAFVVTWYRFRKFRIFMWAKYDKLAAEFRKLRDENNRLRLRGR